MGELSGRCECYSAVAARRVLETGGLGFSVIESGANIDCSELNVLQPWLSEYVDSVPGVTGV